MRNFRYLWRSVNKSCHPGFVYICILVKRKAPKLGLLGLLGLSGLLGLLVKMCSLPLSSGEHVRHSLKAT